MQIVTETFGQVLVAHTPDEFTEDTSEYFVEALRNSVEAGHVQVVLQMDRTEGIDSVGLASLLDIRDLLREAGGNVKLCGLDESCRKVLAITRLDRKIEVFESVIDAVSSFR